MSKYRHIRFEIYEGKPDRLFVDGQQRKIIGETVDIEDLAPILVEMGITVEAVMYEAEIPVPAPGVVNTAHGFDIIESLGTVGHGPK